MITIIGDIGIFNNNPVLIGIKTLFDQKSQLETRILTPSIIYDRNTIAKVNNFRQVSVWSIYDYFTGRMNAPERPFKPEDYQIPEGYQPEIAPVVKKFHREDGARIELETKYSGNISVVNFYNADGKLSQRISYDDGGYMSSIEIPTNENGQDKNQTLFSPDGNKIFELEIVAYRISKIHYLPEDLFFESLDDFYSWAFVRLVSEKLPEDKIFVAQENFRKSLLYTTFNPDGVYLIADSLISGAEDSDIFLDHYEKVVFNVKSDREAVAEKFEGKTDAPLVWNNFSAPDELTRDFSSAPQIYFYIGRESDGVKFEALTNIFTDLLNSMPELKLVLHFVHPYDPPKIVEQLDENLKERVSAIIRPFPRRMLEETAKTDMYVYISIPEAVPPLSLNYAIAGQIPILTLLGQPAIDTFVNTDNGRLVSYEQLSTVIKRAFSLPEGYFELANDLVRVREYFSPAATLERWTKILEEHENKL
ncbi:hypothetical protein OfM1_21010 [Lactovum odontotermitis]